MEALERARLAEHEAHRSSRDSDQKVQALADERLETLARESAGREVSLLKAEVAACEIDLFGNRRLIGVIREILRSTRRQRLAFEATLQDKQDRQLRDRLTQRIHLCLMIEHECAVASLVAH